MAKYTTLAEVKTAFDSGELDKNKHQLVLDNDCSFVFDTDNPDAEEIFIGGGPEEIAEQALDLLGIPWTGA